LPIVLLLSDLSLSLILVSLLLLGVLLLLPVLARLLLLSVLLLPLILILLLLTFVLLLVLVLLLCVDRNSGSQEQQQHCGAYKSASFHWWTSFTHFSRISGRNKVSAIRQPGKQSPR
jgi:hypothetical protein